MGSLRLKLKMFALLILPSAASAWRPAPGIPLERQLPANRQFTSSGSGSGGCEFDPWISECNATEVWCDSGYYNNNHAGTETTVSSRSVTGMAALVFAMSLATGTLRTSATWEWTATTAGWATTAWTRRLAAWTTAATPSQALALA